MKNSLKVILLLVGVILIGYGLYMVFSPKTIIDVGIFQVESNENNFDPRNIIIVALGVLSIVVAVFSKKINF